MAKESFENYFRTNKFLQSEKCLYNPIILSRSYNDNLDEIIIIGDLDDDNLLDKDALPFVRSTCGIILQVEPDITEVIPTRRLNNISFDGTNILAYERDRLSPYIINTHGTVLQEASTPISSIQADEE